MMYLPSDTLALTWENRLHLIDQLRSPHIQDERAFAIIDFLGPNAERFSNDENARLNDQLQAMKWDDEYIHNRPSTFKDNPGAYADWILYQGYWKTRTSRDNQLASVTHV